MNSQLDLFVDVKPDISEEKAFEIISPSLLEVLTRYNIAPEHLTASRKQQYTSVTFQSSLIVRLCFRGSHSYFSISSSYWNLLFKNQDKMPNQAFIQVPVDTPSIHLTDYQDVFSSILTAILDRTPKEYDCCSRFLECSDAKRCIHPEPGSALGCGYKKIMMHGQIFYGKNRNID